ncbi:MULTISPECIES: type VII secretion-associated serine protease mycosin [Mycolicibacterium]|uniref:type VII secretion-associated serine protease mycosin n=1 Tax=Mycolicibacterium monacense TaxID=85693 RepID=UPI0007E9C2B8|nr:type VII secretion-associated serine protease mycosin [Mycolicibacterium monacense]OBB54703.1 type VII secretion-associated serine protease mycosin [Mycolicibacterium monacense]
MTGRITAATLTGLLVAAVPLATAPEVSAVTPPAVDDAFLPAAAPPAPPQRTEQRAECSGAERDRDPPADARQLDMLNLQSVWPLTRGAGQTVAVIDTGVARHRLLPRLMPGGDYVSTGDGTDDCDGHGTLVAGIVAATGEFTGVAPDAALLGIRQSSNKFGAADDPGVTGYGDVQTLATAVRAAADLGATVINVSSVACLAAADALDDRALGAALAYAVDVRNAVVVTAAGNVGGPGQCPTQNATQPGRPDWQSVESVASPAWYDDLVLTVGSVRTDGAPSEFSLAGPWVDVAAPGEHVVSLDPDGDGLVDALSTADGDASIAGTSYAAPVVSGVAALVRSRWPHLTARQVMQRIEDTAHRPPAGWDPVVGHGVVDVAAAVSGGVPADTTETPARSLHAPADVPHDGRPRRVAMAGAGICVAITVLVALSASSHRRGHSDRVARH